MGREHRPAIRLSRLDAEAIGRGEIRDRAEAVAKALTSPEGKAVTRTEEVEPRDARERQLLDELPPHFGKL